MGNAALIRACKEMAVAEENKNWEDAEIVGCPGQYWLGARRLSTTTVNLGLMAMLFRSEGIGTDYERHTLNERGRAFAEQNHTPKPKTPPKPAR